MIAFTVAPRWCFLADFVHILHECQSKKNARAGFTLLSRLWLMFFSSRSLIQASFRDRTSVELATADGSAVAAGVVGEHFRLEILSAFYWYRVLGQRHPLRHPRMVRLQPGCRQ